jgi:opacity protein-like surface antigen
MVRRITVMFVALILVAASASAQKKVEASFNVGYGASEGITSDQTPRLGQTYDTLTVDNGASIGLTVGFFVTPKAEVEFLWARQNSRLQAEGPSVSALPLSELAVYNYMGNFVYNFGEHDANVRPYVFGGLGATQYSFGQNLLPGSTGNIPSDTRFSTHWGGGVKFYFTPNIGARAGVRWTPTAVKTNTTGIWCDPFYGCWPITNTQYSNQFETSGGVTFRF